MVALLPLPAGAALVAWGAYGARPPLAWRNVQTHEALGEGEDQTFRLLNPPRVTWHPGDGYGGVKWTTDVALVLFDGAVLPEGMERAKAVLAAHEDLDPSEGCRWCTYQDNSGLRWALTASGTVRVYTGRADEYGIHVAGLPITSPALALALAVAASGLATVVNTETT